MEDPSTPKRFNAEMCGRLKRLREAKAWSQEQMATALGVPLERYRKYENRSPLPHYLIPRVALICNVTIRFLLTGDDEATRRAHA
jgi:transcriptional regulator with XRE-family HTH domain